MIDTILFLFFNSLYVLGVYLALEDGMIFESIRKKGELLGKLWMPIGGCVTCMASLHSWPYLIEFGFDIYYILYVFALASFNTIIYNKYLADD